LRLRRRTLRGRARRGKDQSLPIQQTFARQKFDQKRRAHARAQKPSTRGSEASAINSPLFKQHLALLGARRSQTGAAFYLTILSANAVR